MALQARPPIITIMGHVDHGKTSLLDYIRQAHVAAGEAGGITQHIGAYQAEYNGKKLTFIDTPGHAAFSKMRSRGASVTDIVVLVVAADDGVMPQTIESIQHIKNAGVPFVVAITKMDTMGASPDMVKAQLTEHEVYTMGYGGDTEAVPLSAKTGEGVNDLLETLSTMGELLELQADPEGELRGVVIESSKDKFLGSVATILVQSGSMHLKDKIYAGEVSADIRTMLDAAGQRLEVVTPSMPAQVTGFEDVPAVGSVVTTVAPEAQAQEISGPSLANFFASLEDTPKLRMILKTDMAGTLEAIQQNIPTENVEIIHTGVGDISESDVSLAETTGARIYAFHVKAPGSIKKLAQRSKVKIEEYKIIYELLESIQNRILKLMEPTIDEEITGEGELLKIFDIRGEIILGTRVDTGVLRKGDNVHLRRGENVVGDAKIASLKQGKTDLDSVEAGQECGIVLNLGLKARVGDKLQAFVKVEQD
jgi:translation initiation factor IF-2